MNCPTCDHAMVKLGSHINQDSEVPKLQQTFSCDGCRTITEVIVRISEEGWEKTNEIYKREV